MPSAYYRDGWRHLENFAPLATASLDAISPNAIAAFIAKHRDVGYQVTTINRHLQVLRRMLKLAAEWGRIEKAPAKVMMLPGERRRDRVLTSDEETRYLATRYEHR